MSKSSENELSCHSPIQISGLNRDERRSAFTPYRPSTVLTNLQRGNVKTETPVCMQDRTVHQLAAQGELFASSFKSDKSFSVDEADSKGYTPLFWAAAYGQLATVKLLLEKGADPKIKGHLGETPLHFAAANGHVHVLKELLKHDLDADEADEEGRTALMFAANGNYAHCVNELLRVGVDITLHNIDQETAFSIAIKNKSKQVQTILERFVVNKLTS